MKGISKQDFNKVLDALAANAKLLVPMEVDGVTRFAPWDKTGKLALGEGNTLIPPKDAMFPCNEKLFNYEMTNEEAGISAVMPTAEMTVILGIRPCDVRAIEALDHVFLTKGYVDEPYKIRRDNTLLVSLGCNQPEATCFCSSVGGDPMRAEKADVMMWDLGESYGLEAISDKGKDLLKKIDNLLSKSSNQPPAAGKFQLEFDFGGVTEKLHDMFLHPIWDHWYQKCLGCGTCTFLCPTCHCFDIQEKDTGQWNGYRYRCWDSCMYPEYSLMAGGHNPRPSKKERIRNRFLHKLCFFPERYGMTLCIGCGRCLQACPVGVDITKFIKEVREVSIGG